MVEWTLQGVGVVEDVGLLPWSPQQFPILLLDGKVLYGAGYYHDKQAPENVLVTIDPARSKGMIASPIDPEFDVSSTQVTLFDSQQRMLWIFTTTQGGVVGALLGPEGWEIEPTVLMPLEEEFPARVLGARYTEDGLECVLWPNSGFLEGYSRVERSDPVIMTLPKGGPVSFRFVTWDVLSREIPADQRLGHQEIPLAHFDEEVGAWSLLVKDGLGLREVTLTETPSVKALLYPEAPSSTTIFDKSRLGFSEGTLGLDRFLWTRRGLTYQPKGERPPKGAYGGRTVWALNPQQIMQQVLDFRLSNLDYQRFDGRDIAVEQTADLTSIRSRNEKLSYPLTPRGVGFPAFDHTTFLPVEAHLYWLIDLASGACRRFRLPELPFSSSSENP